MGKRGVSGRPCRRTRYKNATAAAAAAPAAATTVAGIVPVATIESVGVQIRRHHADRKSVTGDRLDCVGDHPVGQGELVDLAVVAHLRTEQ